MHNNIKSKSNKHKVRNNHNHNNNNRNRNKTSKPYWSSQQKESIVSVQGQGLPDMLMTTLEYADQIILTAPSGYAAYVYRGNSLYDPDYTSTGTQPNEFLQLSAIYSKYRVKRSHIEVEFANGTGNVTSQIIVVPTTEPLTSGASRQQVQELPRARSTGLSSLGGALPRSVSHEISTKVQLGLQKYQDRDEDYSALVTQNPVAIWYWNLFAFNQSLSTLNDPVTVRIAYRCIFYDKVVAAPSYSEAVLLQKAITNQRKEALRLSKISFWESITQDEKFKLSGLEYPAHRRERVGPDPMPYSMPVTVMNPTTIVSTQPTTPLLVKIAL